ncbi:hypothetical protein B484DRAFT_396335, partial [Ochromonadaceae sp. CCMP2298]
MEVEGGGGGGEAWLGPGADPCIAIGAVDVLQTSDLDVRLLACHCLEAMVGLRDQSSSPIFARYPWLLHDLGVNRGQYMGLLPCLLRSATAYLISLTGGVVRVGAQDKARLVWTENVFMLIVALVNVSTALPALTDNGLVSSILMVLDKGPPQIQQGEGGQRPGPRGEGVTQRRVARCSELIFAEIMSIEILESAVTNHTPALAVFRDKAGIEVAVNRLLWELQEFDFEEGTGIEVGGSASSSSSSSSSSAAEAGVAGEVAKPVSISSVVPVANSIIIQELFSLLSSTMQEGTSDSLGQWYKLPALTEALRLIFKHKAAFGILVLSPAISLLSEIVNSDPAPPTILSHILVSGVAAQGLAVLSHQQDLGAGAGAAEGRLLVQDLRPLKQLFRLFLRPLYFYPQSRVLMHDLPNHLGANLEELLRHHPEYASECVAEVVQTMRTLLGAAAPFLPLDFDGDRFNPCSAEDARARPALLGEGFVAVLHASCALMQCLEPLLLKKQTVEAFQLAGGVQLLLQFVHVALGPLRFVLDSFACTVDSTVSSIAYTPLLGQLWVLCSQLSESQPVALFSEVVTELDGALNELQAQLLAYAQEGGGLPAGAEDFPVKGLLDTVSLVPLADYCGSAQAKPKAKKGKKGETKEGEDLEDLEALPGRLCAFASVLRCVAVVDCLVECLGMALQPSGKVGAVTGALQEVRGCFQVLAAAGAGADKRSVLERLLLGVYVPTQLEMARARGRFVNSTQESCVKAHPVYHLLVTAPENVVVRDRLEDSGTKVCKLGRGCALTASERRATPGSNMLKYKTPLGWVSVFRTASATEPQLLVTRVAHKLPVEFAAEVAANKEMLCCAEKRWDFEKFANVSAKRAGFLALYHLNHSVKHHLLAVLAKHLFSKDPVPPTPVSEPLQLSLGAAAHCEIMVRCLKEMMPPLRLPSPVSSFDADAFLQAVKAAGAPEAGSSAVVKGRRGARKHGADRAGRAQHWEVLSSSEGSMNVDEEEGESTEPISIEALTRSAELSFRLLREGYLNDDPVPLLDAFPTHWVYLTIRLAELTHALLFETRRGRPDCNPLVLCHLLSETDAASSSARNKKAGGGACLMEQLLFCTTQVFLCSLREEGLETADLPQHRRMYQGEWRALTEDQLDACGEEVEHAVKSERDVGAGVGAEGASAAEPEVRDRSRRVAASASASASAPAAEEKGRRKRKKDAPEAEASISLPSYVSYRCALRERRILALASLDSMLDYWKLVCGGLAAPVSGAERALQRENDSEHHFDPYVQRRQLLCTVLKYLSQVWTHPRLPSLPPSSAKNVVDLMGVVVDALQEVRHLLNARAPLPGPARPARGSPLGLLQRLEEEGYLHRWGGTGGPGGPGPGGPGVPGEEYAAPPEPYFVPGAEVVRSIEEMGFSRRAILRAAAELRTEAVNALVAYLLENPFLHEEPAPRAPAPSALAVASAAASAAVTAAAASAAVAAAAATDAARTAAISSIFASTGVPVGAEAAQPSSSSSAETTAVAPASSSATEEATAVAKEAEPEPEPRVNPLPLCARPSDAEVKLQRDLLHRLLLLVLSAVSPLCLRLVQRGPSADLRLLDADMKTPNEALTRDMFTVSLLNHLLKCLVKSSANTSDCVLRAVPLMWLFDQAVNILQARKDKKHLFLAQVAQKTPKNLKAKRAKAEVEAEMERERGVSREQLASLAGLLHAIALLFTSKTTGAVSGSGEFLFVMFTTDLRYKKLFPLLVDALETFAQAQGQEGEEVGGKGEGEVGEKGERGEDAERNAMKNGGPCLEWVAPALLLLDIVMQPMLVNAAAIKADALEVGRFLHSHLQQHAGRREGGDPEADMAGRAVLGGLTPGGQPILSPEVSAKIGVLAAPAAPAGAQMGVPDATAILAPAAVGVGADAGGRRGRRKADKGAAKEVAAEGAVKEVAGAKRLPLYDEGVDSELKQRCVTLGLKLLQLCETATVPLAPSDPTLPTTSATSRAGVPHAAMQLLAHLTRQPAGRAAFLLQGPAVVLRTRASFEGMSAAVFTLLQQVLEDEKHLQQSVTTAIKLCYLRLSRQRAQNVSLKSFVEVICPVIYRDQAAFMKTMKACLRFKSIAGQTYVTLRETKPDDEGADAVAGAVASSSSSSSATPAAPAASDEAEGSSKKQRTTLEGGSVATRAAPGTVPGGGAGAGVSAGGEGFVLARTASGKKRSLSSSSDGHSGSETVQQVAEELLSDVVCRWLALRALQRGGQTVSTLGSLTIAELLHIAADLAASLPAFALHAQKYTVSAGKLGVAALAAELPVKHAVTGAPVGASFVAFAVHALQLADNAALDPDEGQGQGGSKEDQEKTSARLAAIDRLTGGGAALRDAVCYFL